jgi:hypothetical protein
MSAHDHPGLSDVTDLAVAVAFLQRVLSVHEIASCHFDLGSFDVVNVGRSEVDGSPGERRALPAATAAAARHFPRLERQLAHFGPASEQIPSFGGLPLRFIGAQRLRSSRSPAHGPASHARDNRNFQRRAGKRRSHIPKIGRQAPVTLSYSDD